MPKQAERAREIKRRKHDERMNKIKEERIWNRMQTSRHLGNGLKFCLDEEHTKNIEQKLKK